MAEEARNQAEANRAANTPATFRDYEGALAQLTTLRRLAGAIAANMPLRLADQFLKECGI